MAPLGWLFPVILVMARTGPLALPEPVGDPLFLVGLYGDDGREVTCVSGPPGATFEQTAWVFVPNDLGLAYVTLRLDFPPNIELAPRAVFHELVSQSSIPIIPWDQAARSFRNPASPGAP